MSRDNLVNSRATTRSVAERLLNLLKTTGPQQAADAGKALGTSGEAARQQFVKLAQEGLVTAVTEVRGVGRPLQRWQLTTAGHAYFPDTHAELTVQLLRLVKSQLGEQALDQLIELREQESRSHYRQVLDNLPTLDERVAKLATLRTQEGYMAEWQYADDGTLLLLENHCPICAAASVCQGFCRAELDVFRDALQARVERSEHILAGARRCVYRITPQ